MNSNSDADEVRGLESERCAALIAADMEALERLLAADLVFVHGSGRTEGKSALLAAISSGRLRYLDIRRDGLKVTLLGEAAIVAGTVETDVETGGEKKRLASRFVSVWARRDGRWSLVHYQATPLRRT